jgi:hypothetical protein
LMLVSARFPLQVHPSFKRLLLTLPHPEKKDNTKRISSQDTSKKDNNNFLSTFKEI